jgi:hypothetical protein
MRLPWVIGVLALGALLRMLRPDSPPWWAYPLTLVAVAAVAGLLVLRTKRQERRLQGSPFISHASRYAVSRKRENRGAGRNARLR